MIGRIENAAEASHAAFAGKETPPQAVLARVAENLNASGYSALRHIAAEYRGRRPYHPRQGAFILHETDGSNCDRHSRGVEVLDNRLSVGS